MGRTPIPQDTSERIARELVADVGGLEWDGAKELPPAQIAGRVLDLAVMLGLKGIPSGRALLADYWQTFGPVILPGTAAIGPADRLAVTAHECRHVQQWWTWYFRMVGEYLGSGEGRVKYEADGALEHLAVRWAITGQLPATLDEAVGALATSYGLAPADLDLARDEIEQGLASIAAGVVRRGPARRVIARLAEENPDYLDAGALAKITAANPEVLTGDLQ